MSTAHAGKFLGKPPPEVVKALPKAVTVKRRSNVYLEQQIEKLQQAKHDLEQAELAHANAQNEFQRHLCHEIVRKMTARHERMTIVLQAAKKIHAELELTRKRLQTNVANGNDINMIRKRISFLEDRMRILVHETDVNFHLNLPVSDTSSESSSVVGHQAEDENHNVLEVRDRSAKEFREAVSVTFGDLGKQDDNTEHSAASPSNVKIHRSQSSILSHEASCREYEQPATRGTSESLVSGLSSPQSVFLTETPHNQAASPRPADSSLPSARLRQQHNDDADGGNYWNNDHHRVAYSSLRHVDFLFYHKMGLSVQDSYVSAGK